MYAILVDLDGTIINSWRKLLKLTQAEAATKLGISRRSVELYESGTRGDSAREVAIPRAIELACAALAAGIENYAGPERHPTSSCLTA
jgi:transcriptional regulator with XRE-family HTH domain